MTDLPEYLADVRDRLTTEWQTGAELAEGLDKPATTVSRYARELRDDYGVAIESNTNLGYRLVEDDTDDTDAFEWADEPVDRSHLPDLGDVDADGDPDPEDLTDREEFIATELQTGASVEDLADELDERPSVVTQHLRDLKSQGWQVYIDESAGEAVIADDDHVLRSSEHTGTRTRKANRWWERTHNRLTRASKQIDDVDTVDAGATNAGESIVFHLTDLHLGDRIRRPSDGVEVFNTPIGVGKADYAAHQAIDFAEDRAREYDVGWVLFGGDLVTCEAIYAGQFEDLDRWLNGQLDAAADAAFRVVSRFAEYFDQVNIICQTGNHGQIRANGSSKQANADLLLYERLRNIIGIMQMADDRLDHVYQSIGEPGRFYDFELRGGAVTGHLRHGDDDRAQNDTAAAQRDWRGRALSHDFDVGWIGHHHKFRRLTVDDRDAFVTPSPKPPGDYAEKLGAGGAAVMDGTVQRKIATVHGVNDDGVTDVRSIDTRDYSAEWTPTDDDVGIPSPDPVPGAIGPDADEAQPD